MVAHDDYYCKSKLEKQQSCPTSGVQNKRIEEKYQGK